MNNTPFTKVFRFLITFFVFGFYVAMVFFSFRQNWLFLLTWEYWIDTSSSTALALMFRWLYSDSGVAKELELNDDIRELEEGKAKEVAKVNQNNLTDLLKLDIDEKNTENKTEAYRTKCQKRINYLREKRWWKINRKKRLERWKVRKQNTYNDDFDVKTVRVAYYRYDFDEMMSTFYKQPNSERVRRQSKDGFIFSSLRTNIITLLAMMIYNALEIFSKDFTPEALTILLGKLVIFSVNIYTGQNLGREYIRNIYSSNLTDDYAFLKGFNKKHVKTSVLATA